MSPFLADRIWGRPPFPATLLRCESCGAEFFNPRLDDAEQSSLYTDYRAASYIAKRNVFEPWYTQSFDEAMSRPQVWADRKRLLRDALGKQIDLSRITSVLDFGGNRGELIDDLIPSAERFVYDISGVAPLPGIQMLRSVEDCAGKRFDLIINSNVLEHVREPREMLIDIAHIATPGTPCFLEVPFESPRNAVAILKRIVQNGILAVKRPRIALSLARSRAFFQMHEHVNFFRPQSLQALLSSVHWSIVASGVYDVDTYKLGGLRVPAARMAWILGRTA